MKFCKEVAGTVSAALFGWGVFLLLEVLTYVV
jgi:hypothetical protein